MMSSNCSINCCSSPEITSSNVSVSNMNGAISNEVSSGRVRTTVPDTKKDNKYWERRRRNNEAARRSREKRRQNDMVMDKRILELSQRNKQLENELFQLKMNFGLVNNSQSKLELDDSNAKLILPNSVQENTETKTSADHINGMVFPTFTTFPTATESLEAIEKPNSEAINISGIGNKINDSPKICNNSNKYQSNLIALSNIPFLSSFISTPNFNEDIASKATLLLPSLVPKTPTKPADGAPCSNTFTTNSKLTVDRQGYSTPQNTCDDNKKRSISIDSTQIPVTNLLKMDIHDILDLRIKQENSECFFPNTENSPNTFQKQISLNEDYIGDSKETVIRNSPDNQSADESMTNSFLSGILSMKSKERLSASVKRKSFINSNCINRLNNKIRRCNSLSESMLESSHKHNKCCTHAVQHQLGLRTRLFIRREVSTIVINENRKLRKDIDGLSREIQQLKSAMLECAKRSVNKPVSSSNPNLSVSDQDVDNNLSTGGNRVYETVASSIN